MERSQHEVRSLFSELRAAIKANDRKNAATAYARLATRCISQRRWKRAAKLLSYAQRCLPESSKLLLAQSICEWERKNEREARKKVQHFAKMVLRKKRLEEYSEVIERELKSYPSLRQVFYESVASIERNSATPFLGLAALTKAKGDLDGALIHLVAALRTSDKESQVLLAIEKILEEQKRSALLVQLERFRTKELSIDDFCLLLSTDDLPLAGPELELGQMIEKLEEELATEEDKPPGLDKVGPLLNEFRTRAHPIIGKDSKTRIDLALAFFEMKLYFAGRDELKLIEEDDPLFGEALCLLGQIYLEEGSVLAAMETYQKCLRLDRYRGTRIFDEAEYQLIRTYVKLEDYGKAVIHLRELERRVPDYREMKRLKEQVAQRLGVESLPEIKERRKLRKTG